MQKLTLQQGLQQKLSPQQIQLMKLLQVPTIAIDQRIKEELESNPALEEGDEEPVEESNEDDFEDDEKDKDENSDTDSKEDEFDLSDYMEDDEVPSYKLSVNNRSKDDEEKSLPIAVSTTFNEILLGQLGMLLLEEKEHIIAEYIIGSFDDDGYLRRELSAMVDDLAFTQNISTNENELGSLLHLIQGFDPPGVGARDLKECLIIQLKRKGSQTHARKTAMSILENMFEEFTRKHYDKISGKMNLSEDELRGALNEILKLNPRPGNSAEDSQKPVQHIVPDFTINASGGEIDLSLNSSNAPELRISKTYHDMIETYTHQKQKGKANKMQKDAMMFAKQKIDSANWFIDAIMQRQQTLMKTMSAIVNYQKEYFITGDETKLKPMILKDIAEIVEMDISTVSRVANSKYVQTPYGTFLLKTFFSESLQNESGEEVSTREIKKILKDCIAAEEKKKPVTDEKLVAILKEKGYNIARRTIAKYREHLNIPVARMRKQL